MSVEVGKVYNGKVSGLTKFGAFVKLESGESGLVHISEIADSFVSEIKDFLSEGQDVSVKVLNIDDKGRLNFSIKKASEQQKDYSPETFNSSKKNLSFEDMLSRFKQESEEKLPGTKNIKIIKNLVMINIGKNNF